ncbi:MAG: patatin-like phospholipase family protein [Betaproteobacteria bacterium]
MAKYRILSLDGGGVRGLLTTILLARIGEALGSDSWLNKADLLAGTSTGGLIALGIARGLSLPALRALYEEQGEEIFDDSWIDDLTDIGKIAGADYGGENRERVVKAALGAGTRLRDLGKRVLIPSFDLDNEDGDPRRRRWKAKLFHNFPGAGTDGAELAYKVAMYTSAAPTYFPSYEGYVDGGVYANNPSMCALAQVLDRNRQDRPKLSEVAMLSIGTGTSLVHIEGKALDWGYAQWAKPLVEVMFEGVADIARYQCEQLLGGHFHRVAPTFGAGETFPLDGVDKIPDLVAFAGSVSLDETVAWVRRNWL